MHLPAFIIALGCLLLACSIGDYLLMPIVLGTVFFVYASGVDHTWKQEEDACREWMNIKTLYQTKQYEVANREYEKLYSILRKKNMFLFEYGHCLHNIKCYEKSIDVLNEALKYTNDPMVLNLLGKNYQYLKAYELAESYYLQSINRLPGRIYPYYLLAKLYADSEFRNKEKFEEMKMIVLTKQPKVSSMAIREMRFELKNITIK